MATNGTESSLNSTRQRLETNGWQGEYLTPTNFILIVVAIILETPFCVVTTLLNVLVILAVWRKRYLRKQKPCVLLACLAATDLLVGAVALPLVIAGHIMRLVGVGPLCVVDKITVDILYIAGSASLYHLVIISGERYVAIKHALRYETLVTTRRLTTAVAVIWATSIVSTMLGSRILYYRYNTVHCAENTALRGLYLDAIILLVLLGSLTAISFFQVAVYSESRRHRKHIMAHQVPVAAAREFLKKDKAARTTTMVVGVLWLCYAPTVISQAVILIVRDMPMSSVLGSSFIIEVFLYFNSLVNPIIYCMRTRDFRRALRELLNRQAAPEFNGRGRQSTGAKTGTTEERSSPLFFPKEKSDRPVGTNSCSGPALSFVGLINRFGQRPENLSTELRLDETGGCSRPQDLSTCSSLVHRGL